MSASEAGTTPPNRTDRSATNGADAQRDDAAGTLTRGFLFADLRGYTSFVERRGASAAARLLDRYRILVRAHVARFSGAEIKTEGDSFYVVFGSVSRAVECALGIVSGAAEATEDDPDHPIRVGIGVHAGETVETPEGYVGSAVNMAARLCSAAAAGEVLVSDTVRAITANTTSIQYRAMGRRRLRGMTDPVAVYRAVPSGTVVASGGWGRVPVIVGAAAGLATMIVVIGALVLRPGGEPPVTQGGTPSATVAAGGSPSSLPSMDPTAIAVSTLPIGALSPGEYTSVIAHPDVTFRVGDGWTLVNEVDQLIHLTWSAAPGRDLFLTRFEDPIEPDDPSSHVTGVNNAAAFVDWLSTHPYLMAESPVSVDLQGSRGLSLDFTADIPESDVQASGCPRPCIALYWIWERALTPPDRFGIIDGARYRVLALDRPGTSSEDASLIVVVVEVQRSDEFADFVTEAQSLMSSIRFTDD